MVSCDSPADMHVLCGSLCSYWVLLHRWEELLAFSRTSSTPWPVEATMEEAFETFALGVSLTEQAYNAPIRVSGAPLDLQALKNSLHMGPCPVGTTRVHPAPAPCHCQTKTTVSCPCPANWTHNGTDCRLASCDATPLPACNTPTPQTCSKQPPVQTIPSDIKASSVYKNMLNRTSGAWNAGAKTGWVELSFPQGTLIRNMSASFNLSPQPGYRNELSLDGHKVLTWNQSTTSLPTLTVAPSTEVHVPTLDGPYRADTSMQRRPAALIMTWTPTMPVAGTKLRLTTTLDVSWVSYGYIQVYTC
eukprot:COSAG02_NODE_7487_length_2990_cov_113.820330_1_plen_303_part_00